MEQTKNYPSYKIVYKSGNGEYIEKKSRFIASVEPVSSEAEAVAYIEAIRKKYWDAKHHCSAFVLGERSELTRCSDDGEPSGTAGKPILEVLMGAQVTGVVVVVTRYFGGTLLGTGGLVRAYTQAAKEGLTTAGIATMRYGTTLTIETDYTDLGKVQYIMAQKGIEIMDSRYTQIVETDVRIPEEQLDMIQKELIAATCARAKIQKTGSGYYMDKTGQNDV